MTTAIETSAPSDNTVACLIDGWSANPKAGLISRKGVFDMLLDLRNAVDGDDLAVVDSVLIDVPGATVVESAWWAECVDDLRLRISAYTTG